MSAPHELSSSAAAIKVADIARVPEARREAFLGAVSSLVMGTQHNLSMKPEVAKDFERLEQALNDLHNAFRDLTDRAACYLEGEWQGAIFHICTTEGRPFPAEIHEFMESTKLGMRALLLACAIVTNRNPNRRGKKENLQDWIFQGFVAALWAYANQCWGKLSANCKHNVGSGTMFKALEELRPYFIRWNFIKPVLPAQTIANIVKATQLKVPKEPS